MGRYKEIKDKILYHYQDLRKNHKNIADFFIENFDRVPFLTVQDVSKASKTSVASVIRFTQRVGFTGFSEMQNEIARTLQTHLQNKDIFQLINNDKLKEDILTSVANQDISNINETVGINDRENFHKAVELILASNRVYTAGLGISSLLAQILSYQLNQVSVDSHALVYNSLTFLEQLLFLTKHDLLIVFSFPPYSKETIDAAKFAAGKGIRTIAITNKQSAPVTLCSNIQLIVKSENMLFTNSFAAISVIINALATECAFRNRSKANKMVKELNKISELQQNTID
ncbi:MAG: MurR/RpiR family transcriptional regulator [Ignavibacteriales bacterium]|nr:MAG: MurR/RpiR family transcriptional regulator [Ignavibacteriales bacterium]